MIKLKQDTSLINLKKGLKTKIGFFLISSDMEIRENGKIYEQNTSGKWRGYTIDKFFKYRMNTTKARKIQRALQNEWTTNWANIKPRDILTRSNNSFLRRRWIEHYGPERIMEDLGANVVDKDGTSTLYTIPLNRGEEPLVYVQVEDTTTGKQYYLRVPPHIKTCKRAIAWTFGLEPDEYKPEKET